MACILQVPFLRPLGFHGPDPITSSPPAYKKAVQLKLHQNNVWSKDQSTWGSTTRQKGLPAKAAKEGITSQPTRSQGKAGKFSSFKAAEGKNGRQQAYVEPEEEVLEEWKSDDELEEDSRLPLSLLPSPPAGFILEDDEVVLMAPPHKRTLTMTDPETGSTLDCLIRRAFVGPTGGRFFVLIPLDTPVQILRLDKKENAVVELEDDEVEEIFPSASYALAKKSLHLMLTGFCLTARGAICFTEEAVINLESEYGLGVLGNLGEGVEICKFVTKGQEYIIFTPFDPLLFVAYEDASGQILLADSEEYLNDSEVQDAIFEETEFNRMVDEEEDVVEALRLAKKKA